MNSGLPGNTTRAGGAIIHPVIRTAHKRALSWRVRKQNLAKIEPMDWSECPFAETKLGVQGGRPVLKGTRMPVDDIVDNWEAGEDELEIAANFRLPLDQVKAILEYAAKHQNAPRPVR